jgi:hypothetical protein
MNNSPEVGSMLQHAISLCAARATIRERLRTQVNKLHRPLRERQHLYRDLMASEFELTEKITQLLPHLDPDDAATLKAKYNK